MTPEQVNKLINFGQMALEQGWYDKAGEYFEQALALDASNREAMKGLAWVNEILSRRTDVTVELTQVEPVEPPSEPESTHEPEPSRESVEPPQERMEPPHIERKVSEVKSKELIELTCQNCGGHLIVVEESDQFTCPYCGTVYEAKRDKDVIAFRQLREGVEGIKLGTDRMASELAIKRLNGEMTSIVLTCGEIGKSARPSVVRLDYLKRTFLWRLFHQQEVQELEGRLQSIIKEMRRLNEILEHKFKEYQHHKQIVRSTILDHEESDVYTEWLEDRILTCIESSESLIEVLLQKIKRGKIR